MATLINLFGEVRADGGTVFCFIGPPNVTVQWDIIEGGGTLFHGIDYTDEFGRASCLYQASGFFGTVIVQVTYGS